MANRRLLVGAGIIVVCLGAIQLLSLTKGAPSLEDSTEAPSANENKELQVSLPAETNSVVTSATVEKKTTTTSTSHPLPLASGDSISSWDFKDAYTGNPNLVMQAEKEIKNLSSLVAAATSSKMTLLVGIANQYELLGDGKNQYEYLEKAIQADPANGLPWHNLGVLMERLGALATAKTAYEKATRLQPQLGTYQFAYLEFLISRMPNDTAGIENAFAWAEKNIGKAPYLSDLRATWKGS